MRSFGVVVFPPLFDQDLSLAQAVEDLTVQKLVAEPGVEAFAVSVLPGAARLDVGGLGANGFNPVLNRLSNELWAVVRADIGRHTAQDEQVAQGVDHIARVQLALYPDCQTFPAVFVEDVQSAEHLPIVGSMMHEVIRPDVIAMLGPEPNA